MPVYFGDRSTSTFILWTLMLATIVISCTSLIGEPSRWDVPVLAVFMSLWLKAHFDLIKRTYTRFYTTANTDRLEHYRDEYQYIQYCLFRERLNTNGHSVSITEAIDHLDIDLEARTTSDYWLTTITTITIAAGAVWLSKPDDDVAALMTVCSILCLGLTFLIRAPSLFKTRRLKKLRRFLLWLEAESLAET